MKDFIEKHSIWIGSLLIILTLIGGTLLMVKKGAFAESRPQESDEQKTLELESKISDLEKQISDLKSMTVSTNSTIANPPSSNPETSSTSAPVGKININSANQSQLESLPGIGATYAKRIIEYRNSHGGFKSIAEIKNVKGIGDKTFAKFKDLITI